MKFKSARLEGVVEGIYRTPVKTDFVTESLTELQFNLDGIQDDRHSGFERLSNVREKKYYPDKTQTRNNRQWSGVSKEELLTIQDKMGVKNIDPCWLGANIMVSGIPNFSKLPPLSHLMIGKDKTCLVIFEENLPCGGPDRVIKEKSDNQVLMGFQKAGLDLRGVVGWIDKGGTIKVGDKIEVLIPDY